MIFRKNWILVAAIAASSVVAGSAALRADDSSEALPSPSPSPSVVLNVETQEQAISRIQATSEADLQDQANAEADTLEGASQNLTDSQGVTLDPDSQAALTQAAGDIRDEAAKPGFKERLLKGLKKAGLVTLQGIGYAGRATFDITLTPFFFATDLGTEIVSDQPMFTASDPTKLKASTMFVGYGTGAGALTGTVIGIGELSVDLATGILVGGAGAYALEAIICSSVDSQKAYCSHLRTMDHAILIGSADGGAKTGNLLHRGLWKVGGFFKHIFVHSKPASAPAGGSAS